MLRIEKESDGHTTTLQLSGQIQSANIGATYRLKWTMGTFAYSWIWVKSLLWLLKSFDP
jgi:hypothetical protein